MSIHSTGIGNDEPLVVSPRRARELLSIGNSRLYEILPQLESYKDGKSRRITLRSINAYIDRRLAESQQSRAA